MINFYKQNSYDPSDSKIGGVDDILIDKEGRVTAAIIGVGGFLGMGEKDVAVPFSSVRASEKNGDVIPRGQQRNHLLNARQRAINC